MLTLEVTRKGSLLSVLLRRDITEEEFERVRDTLNEVPVVLLVEANGADPLNSETLAGSTPTRVIEIDWDEIERGDGTEYAQAILDDVAEYGVEEAMGEQRMAALREKAMPEGEKRVMDGNR